MKQKTNLMDFNFEAFDPDVRSEIKAEAQAAQNLLDISAAVIKPISSLKKVVVSLFSGNSKAQRANTA